MGVFKKVQIMALCFFLALFFSCSNNTHNEQLEQENKELEDENQELLQQLNNKDEQLNDILYMTGKLTPIANKMISARGNIELGTFKTKSESITDDLNGIERELKKSKLDEKTRKALQASINAYKKEITVLQTANNAWVAFNVNDYNNAYQLFLSSDESSKREGSRAFLNKALQLIAARNGECDNTAKSFLLQAKELNNTQQIRDLINKCK